MDPCDHTQEFGLLPEAASTASLLAAKIQTQEHRFVSVQQERVHFFMSKLVKLYTSIGESFSSTAKGRSYGCVVFFNGSYLAISKYK